MSHLFCPYQEAIELKQLGFEEDCFGWYFKDKSFYTGLITINSGFLLAPLYQQAFDWFREKHGITCVIMDFIDDEIGVEWDYSIHKIGTDIDKNGNWTPLIDYSIDDPERKFKTYKDAKLACLQKLITLVKNDNTTRS